MLSEFEVGELDRMVDEYRAVRYHGDHRNRDAAMRFEEELRRLFRRADAHDNQRSHGAGSNSAAADSSTRPE